MTNSTLFARRNVDEFQNKKGRHNIPLPAKNISAKTQLMMSTVHGVKEQRDFVNS